MAAPVVDEPVDLPLEAHRKRGFVDEEAKRRKRVRFVVANQLPDRLLDDLPSSKEIREYFIPSFFPSFLLLSWQYLNRHFDIMAIFW